MIILDAYALLAYFNGEQGAETVRQHLETALEVPDSVMMSAVNVGEVLYIIMRAHGSDTMLETERHIYSLPIRIVDVDMELTRVAAHYKASGGISYADCFAAALAKQAHAPVLTGDPDFKTLEPEIEVQWL